LINYYPYLKVEIQTKELKSVYFIVLTVAAINIAGTFPWIAELVINNRFILIAWLHFLFLGLYVPFIWVFISNDIPKAYWIIYLLSFVFTEVILVFPNMLQNFTSVSAMHQLFYSYFLMFIGISLIHIFLFNKTLKTNSLKSI